MIWINVFIGVVLRLLNLGARPFDGDEGIILKLTEGSWSNLFTQTTHDVHPPLYHVLVKLMTVSGVNEWTARIGSVLLGILAIYLIYIFSKNIFDKKIALVASFLAAISPYLLYPAQEARMYALFLVLSLLSFYFFFKLLLKNNTKDFIWLTIFSVLLLYTQYLGFVIIGSQIIYLLFRRDQYKFWKSYLISYLAIAVLFIPQFSTMIDQFQSRVAEQSQAVSLIDNFKGLIGAFYRFGAGRLFLDINPSSIKDLASTNIWLFILFLVSILVPFGIFGYGKVKLYFHDKKKFWLLFTPIAIAVMLALVSSEVGSRASRYLIYIYPFYIIVVSYAFLDFWKAWWGKMLAITFIIINLMGIYTYFSRDVASPGANKIADFIHQNYKEGDAILVRGGFGGGETWVLNYYLDQKIPAIYDMFGDYQPGNLADLKAIKPENKINELLEKYNTVYFYDMTYQTNEIPNSKAHELGKDKEDKSLTVWEINK